MEEVDELRNLQRGDQIGVTCLIKKVKYFRFGIYLGPNKGVAEFRNGYLRIVDLLTFKDDLKLIRVVYQQSRCHESEKVAKTAEDLVKNPQNWSAYNPLTNNCEHFATYCKTGKAFTKHSILEKAVDYTVETAELRNIQRGDQIGVICLRKKVEYYHFGIYLGLIEGVAEFGEKYLRKVDLLAFIGDSKLFRAVYQPDQCLASEEVAKRAEDIVNNKSWGTYNLLTNNCEHFATHCKTEKAFSKQVDDHKLVGKMVFILKAVGSQSLLSSSSSCCRSSP